MADRYWVGGTGNWGDTARWSASSGGSSGASVPTSADNVIFDANSNVGTNNFIVTVNVAASCLNFSTGGGGGALDGTMTISVDNDLSVYGDFTLPATNFIYQASASLIFAATSTGKTITTNGTPIRSVVFNGVGGGWTLGSAVTIAISITFTAGTFSTANYTLTTSQIIRTTSGGATTVNFGSSTLSLDAATPINITNTTNLTWNAGTSTITLTSNSVTFNGAGLTYYNVSHTGTTSLAINDSNTFNNLTLPTVAATGRYSCILSANQTVNGTFTPNNSANAIRRSFIYSSVQGTQRTITLNGTLATMTDTDFRDIKTAGTAGTWTGTRIGDLGNNSGITTSTPKTVYWNLAGTQNWSATAWAATNNGVPAANNFPLAQDTAVFTEAGSAGTITIEDQWLLPSVNMQDGVSNRTTAFTLTFTTTNEIVGDFKAFSNLTTSGSGALKFSGYSKTQNITSAGVTFSCQIQAAGILNTVKLIDNLTCSSSLILGTGTFDLNNNTATFTAFSSSATSTRALSFGTGKIIVSAASGNVISAATLTGFTYSGTPRFELPTSASTRTILWGSTAGGSESNAINLYVTAGTSTVTVTAGSHLKILDFTGFTGTLANTAFNLYGNLVIASGMTLTAGANALTFAATSGTQQVTTNAKTFDFPITVNAPGATIAFQDALTQGSTRAFTFTAGTLQFKNSATSTVGAFSTTGTTAKFLQSTSSGSSATISQASGTVDISYTTVKDSAAIGGATFLAYTSNNNVDGGNNTGWAFVRTLTGTLAFTLDDISMGSLRTANVSFTLDDISAVMNGVLSRSATIAFTLDSISMTANVGISRTATIAFTLDGVSVNTQTWYTPTLQSSTWTIQ